MRRLCFLLCILTVLLCGCLPAVFGPTKPSSIAEETTPGTPPDQTPPDQTPPDITTPDITTPDITTTEPPSHKHLFVAGGYLTEPTCAYEGVREFVCECGATTTFPAPATGKHAYGNATVTKVPTCVEEGEVTETCSLCDEKKVGTIPKAKKHNYVNNVCAECQKTELVLTPVASNYDADGDGDKDTYYFAPSLAERCAGAIWLWAGDYDKALSTSVSKATFSDVSHWYVDTSGTQKLVYLVTVPEAGTYEMIIHMRLKDGIERGATYTVNAGKPWAQTFQTSHAFADDACEAVRTPDTLSSYMYGIKVNLVAGMNTLAITVAPDSPKTQHYRDFYFVKVGDFQVDDHIHSYTETLIKPATCSSTGQKKAICLCGESKTITVPATREHTYLSGVCTVCNQTEPTFADVPSIYDADGNGENDVYQFSTTLLDICQANTTVHVAAKDYDKALSSETVASSTKSGIKHWYIDNEDQYLVYRVTVPEEGVYEMILHFRMKDGNARGAKFIINEGSIFEQVFSTSHSFDGTEYENVRDKTTLSSYMYGVKVHLQAGENLIKIVKASTSYSQHFRDFYFVKVGEIHYHLYENEISCVLPTCATEGERVLSCTCNESTRLVLPATNEHLYIDDVCFYCGKKALDCGIVDYEFLSQKAGFAGGTVLFLPEVSGTYTLYWADENGKLASYTMLGSFVAHAGNVTNYTVHDNTAIPVGATQLIVVNSTFPHLTYSFTIPKEKQLNSKKLYTFGALSDTHQGTRYGPENQSVDRLIRAGQILSEKGAVLVGINGDIANKNTEREYVLHAQALQKIYELAPDLPVFCTSGNHEAKYTGFSREWYLKYTRDVVDYKTDLTPVFADGNELDFVIKMPDGSVIIFLHQIYYDYGKPTSRLMDDAQLDWLGRRLEEYKDRTVFLFFHTEMEDRVGDFSDDNLVMEKDTEDYRRLDAYFKQYTNVVFFNGHSHGSFRYVLDDALSDRIFNTYSGEYATLVHIPSLAHSQLGYIVHVYEDCILFEGYDFGNDTAFSYANFIIEK